MKLGVAITGASGAIYGKLLLEKLSMISHTLPLEIQLVMSKNAKSIWEEELGNDDYKLFFKQFHGFDSNDFYAPMASGSSNTEALVICPCSMGTLARIASGISNDLVSRASDVMLKERKKLICIVRESPLNLIQINNMKTVTEAGGIILPASPSFYSKPKSIEEACGTIIDRIIHLLGLPYKSYEWPTKIN